MNAPQLSEQETIRRASMEEMRRRGIEPYPAAEYPVTGYSDEIKENFKDDEPERPVSVAGRVMGRRIMGKASFMELQDSKGRIQVYVNRDEICPGEDKDLYNVVFKKLLDIGDFVGVKGHVFRTKTGEISVHATELTVLGKSLRPLPVVKIKDGVVYDSFDDPELRYRRRYVDLVVNDGVKEIFIKRTKVYNSMREYFNNAGYMEVETPILQSIPGGAAARPFITHHNALDIPLYLRIADELYLKRLIVGGFEGVYEFSKNFRNEGMDRTHNPEFTCMEIYVAYKDYNWMMSFTEKMLEKICLDVNGTTEVKVGDNVISFKAPFPRVTRPRPSRTSPVSTSPAWTRRPCAAQPRISASKLTSQWVKASSSTRYSARSARATTSSPHSSSTTPSRCHLSPSVTATTPSSPSVSSSWSTARSWPTPTPSSTTPSTSTSASSSRCDWPRRATTRL